MRKRGLADIPPEWRDIRFWMHTAPPESITIYVPMPDHMIPAVRRDGFVPGTPAYVDYEEAKTEARRIADQWKTIPIVAIVKRPMTGASPEEIAIVADYLRKRRVVQITSQIAPREIADFRIIDSPMIPHFRMVKALPRPGEASWWQSQEIVVYYHAPRGDLIEPMLKAGVFQPGEKFYYDLGDAFVASDTGFILSIRYAAGAFEPDPAALQDWSIDMMFKVFVKLREDRAQP